MTVPAKRILQTDVEPACPARHAAARLRRASVRPILAAPPVRPIQASFLPKSKGRTDTFALNCGGESLYKERNHWLVLTRTLLAGFNAPIDSNFRGGRIVTLLGACAQAVRDLARDKDVPLIDLHASSIELLNRLGPVESDTLGPTVDGRPDRTHLSAKGQAVMAALVADLLREAVPELAPHLILVSPAVPPRDQPGRTGPGYPRMMDQQDNSPEGRACVRPEDRSCQLWRSGARQSARQRCTSGLRLIYG